eukprot:scaffold254693_cov43-Cyclotella_meneghiniana.AAC.1
MNARHSAKSSLKWPTLAVQFNDFLADIDQPTAHVPEDKIAVVVFPLFKPKCVSIGTVAAKPLQLDHHSYDSLWDKIAVVVFPLLTQKCVDTVSVMAKPLQLDHSNDSLWVPEEEIAVVVFHLFTPKYVSIGTVAAKPLQLDHSNDSLW